jgi:hypothetical protein
MLYMAGMLAPSGFVIMTGDADETVHQYITACRYC